jgi:hypothetical protein
LVGLGNFEEGPMVGTTIRDAKENKDEYTSLFLFDFKLSLWNTRGTSTKVNQTEITFWKEANHLYLSQFS